MKLLVPIKRVPDPYSKIKLRADATGIDTTGLKFEINPFDEIAVEEAIRIGEKVSCEIAVVTIGDAACEEQLRKALAMGAHRAVRVDCAQPLDSLGVAKILAKVFEKERPDLVLMGKQAIDDDCNQAGQMLAGMLNLPQAAFASSVSIDGGTARVSRETDEGQETLEIKLPAVVTADLRLNVPRYVALPGIIKARTKPIETLSLADLGVDAECRVRTISLSAPPPRAAGRKVANVDELLSALRTERGFSF